MKNVQVLDCTLRDGGRIIDCNFDNTVIKNIAFDLALAGIDIVELGFLRSKELVTYHENSTFFTEINQIDSIVETAPNVKYVAFIDYGMFDFGALEECNGNVISGLRVGFTKDEFLSQPDEIKEALQLVKRKGYKLYVQGVNSLSYTDAQLLGLIDIMNEIKPYSFGIVDTYGGMYLDDLVHIFDIVNHNLNENICIDIHSHNNFQSSFAFAQEVVRLAEGNRNIILDATLNGMGKCAGNLNTELIVDFLNRKKNYDYDIDRILDCIDRYILPLKMQHEWGYSIPAFMAGIYKSHPNNIIYLTTKYRLNSKDIKYIISGIDEHTRQKYDYDNIRQIYKEYNESKTDDSLAMSILESKMRGKEVFVIVPGANAKKYESEIKDYIIQNSPVVISLNYVPDYLNPDMYFFANPIHWGKLAKSLDHSKCILTSNVREENGGCIRIDYSSLTEEASPLADNSTIMLLNLLKKVDCARVTIAGFDGLSDADSYVDNSFIRQNGELTIEQTNREISKLYNNFKKKVAGKMEVSIITPSLYEQ